MRSDVPWTTTSKHNDLHVHSSHKPVPYTGIGDTENEARLQTHGQVMEATVLKSARGRCRYTCGEQD